MTPAEVLEARKLLGLTQPQAAALIGVGARTWRHWESGAFAVPEPAARLLRLAVYLPRVRKHLEALAEKCAGDADSASPITRSPAQRYSA